MLIDFKYLFEKYKVQSKGVLHIGANTGQEAEEYKKNGIERFIWIEAIPEVFNQLVEHVDKFENTICINACISDEDGKEVSFNVSSNAGESSSFLELGTHAIVHPDVKYVRAIKMITKRVSTIFTEMGLNMEDYTFLNIDLQGAEMFALRGMGAMLRHVDYAYLEVNNQYLYEGCSLIKDIDEFMDIFEFTRVEVHWAGNTGWGDAFYVKKKLIMNPFGKIFVVNMDNKVGQERLGLITNHFTGHGIQFERFKATESYKGSFGLLWTMKRLFIKCVTENLDNVLVFEDDAMMVAPFWPFIENVWPQLPKDYDCLYLGVNLLSVPERISENILRIRSGYATHAIVYSLAAIRKILVFLDSMNNKECLAYDILLMKNLQTLQKCYCTYPMLVLQRPGYSSIEMDQRDWGAVSTFTFNAHTLHI